MRPPAAPPEFLPASSVPVDTFELGFGVEYSSMRTLIWCLSSLAVAYFVLSALLAFLRLRDQTEAQEHAPSAFRRVLEAAELTFSSAPMLCILFLAAQIQAVHISGGQHDPPVWMRRCMAVATMAYLAQTMLAMVAPAITGEVPMIDEDAVVVQSGSTYVTMASRAAMLILCGACAAICLGVLATEAHQHLLPRGGAGTSPSVTCTVALTLQFFLVHLCLMLASSSRGCARGTLGTKMVRVLRLAAHTVFFAPMLCVLFIGARLRAMEVDRERGMPQAWAQTAFYASTWALEFQTILAVVVPLLPGGDARRSTSLMGGDVEVSLAPCGQGLCRLLFVILQYLPGFMLFACVALIIASILLLAGPGGSRAPALPATTRCLLTLTVQFFVVYGGLWVAIVVREVARDVRGKSGFWTRWALKTLHAASHAAQTCPMLAVLFLALRLRAQQLTGNTGHPQWWAQMAMYICTGALVALTLLAFQVSALAAIGKRRGERPAGEALLGTVDVLSGSLLLRRAIVGTHLLASAGLYGGAMAVGLALFVATPGGVRA